jgi:phytanoyl-CoA hydroxylase
LVVLPDIFTPDEVEPLRRVTDALVEKARQVAANDEIYDLEDSHAPAAPRGRRIKTPHLFDPEYARAARIRRSLHRCRICGARCGSTPASST